MGGRRCKTDEERRLRRNAASLKYYNAHKNDPGQKEKHRETGNKASLKYYHSHKEKCIESVINWRVNNMDKVKRYNKKAYQKRKHNRQVIFIKKQSIQKPEPVLAVVE